MNEIHPAAVSPAADAVSQVLRVMPLYKCHKFVWALKIKEIRQFAGESTFEGGSWLLDFEEDGFDSVEVSHRDYVLKHSPHAGGYYVVYADGYRSFSPAKSFEDGYARVDYPGVVVRKYKVVGRDGSVSDVVADYFEWQSSDLIFFGTNGKEVAAFRDWSYFTTE